MYDFTYLSSKINEKKLCNFMYVIFFTYGNIWSGFVAVLPVFVAYTPTKRLRIQIIHVVYLFITIYTNNSIVTFKAIEINFVIHNSLKQILSNY